MPINVLFNVCDARGADDKPVAQHIRGSEGPSEYLMSIGRREVTQCRGDGRCHDRNHGTGIA